MHSTEFDLSKKRLNRVSFDSKKTPQIFEDLITVYGHGWCMDLKSERRKISKLIFNFLFPHAPKKDSRSWNIQLSHKDLSALEEGLYYCANASVGHVRKRYLKLYEKVRAYIDSEYHSRKNN